MKKPFCVIHPLVDASRTKRTWLKSVDEGVTHAMRLLEVSKRSGRPTRQLFVVQVVKVVEPLPEVKVTVREPIDADIMVYGDDDEDDAD